MGAYYDSSFALSSPPPPLSLCLRAHSMSVHEYLPHSFFFTSAYGTPLCRYPISLFNHSFMYQHLGCFQYFAMINNDMINNLVRIFLCCWMYFPEKILLNQNKTCIYNSIPITELPSRRVAPVCILTNNV